MQVAMKKNVIRRRLIEPKSNTDNDPDPRDGGVQCVDRALLIIETLAEDDEGYRLSDLAVRTGLSTSTVHRLLATLEKRRFVHFDRHESKWHVGAQSFAVGATFARRRNFVAQAMPYLRKLRDQTRETANLAVVDDESIIVLTRMESREIMRSLTKVGGRVAMVASGVGKAVLATYSDEDVNAIIRRQGMPRLTESRSCGPATCSGSFKRSGDRVTPSMTRRHASDCGVWPPWSTMIAANRLRRFPCRGWPAG